MHPDIARLHLENEGQEPVRAPPQPLGYTSYSRARDITREFLDASAELKQGQLVKDEYFTLFESVGALEIMDPKMDSGYMMPEKDAIVDNFDPLKPMLPEEVIGIMDQMLCHEMSWHDGYPLSQTLFTSLHLIAIAPQEFRPLETVYFQSLWTKNPDPLLSQVLRAYCVGLLKSCDSVIADIISEHYYEEEDFVTQTFSQYLLSDIDDAAIIAAMEAAQKTLETLDLSADIKSALSARLELRALMLQAYEPQSASVNYDEKVGLWKQVLAAANKVNNTNSLGKAVPDVFSERVQRHLASNTPPRPMIETTWSEAYSKLKKLCEANIEAYRIVTISESPSPYNIIRFVADFSAHSPPPTTHPRSILQSLLFRANSLTASSPHPTSHLTLLTSSLSELVLTSDPLLSPQNWEIELPSSPRHQIAQHITAFLTKSREEFLNIPRMLSQNLCRQRRTLNQSIAILDSLQAEAELVDAAIQDIVSATLSAPPSRGDASPSSARSFALSLENLPFFPLAAWVYFWKLLVAEWTVLLGFETDVYLSHEAGEMYAFLSFLAKTREEHLGHIDFFAHRRAQRLGRSGDRNGVEAVVKGRAFLKVLILRAKVVATLAEVVKDLYALLAHLSLSSSSPANDPPYSTRELRHELRMKPFLPIGTPVLPSPEDLASQTNLSSSLDPSTPISQILGMLETSLKEIKTDLAALKAVKPEVGGFRGCEKGWSEEVRGLLGTVVSCGVLVSSLRSICGKVGVVAVGDLIEGSDEGKEKKRKRDEMEEKIKKGWEVQIPEVGKRWRGGWAVPVVKERK